MLKKNSVDKTLLLTIIILVIYGITIYLSASLGLLMKGDHGYFSKILNQISFGLVGGSIFCYINSRIPYRFWKTYSFWFFIVALVLTLSVFIKNFGMEINGAKRWLLLGPLTFQPSELLKITYIIYLAAWFAAVKEKINTFQFGFLPFIIISIISASILFAQPDNDTVLVMLISGGIMFFIAGANWKHIIVSILIVVISLTSIVLSSNYVRNRIDAFFRPQENQQTSGYQVRQSLIAIGSGGLLGRGFGQSIQKFEYLPEPISDSIFAVLGEEFGFIGSIGLIVLFILLLIRCVKISILSKDSFGGLLVVGLGILIVSQAFINMASMLGIFPLAGLPLSFVSHGGTALFFTLFSSGIMLNISRYKQTNQT